MCPLVRVAVLVIAFSAVCSAQELTVRVLNENNLKPLSGVNVSVQFLDATSGPAQSLTTGVNGDVQFSLPPSHPQHLSVQVKLHSEHWHCPCRIMAYTETIVEKGILQSIPNKHERTAEVLVPKPAEIVIVARPLSFRERLLHPFVKN